MILLKNLWTVVGLTALIAVPVAAAPAAHARPAQRHSPRAKVYKAPKGKALSPAAIAAAMKVRRGPRPFPGHVLPPKEAARLRSMMEAKPSGNPALRARMEAHPAPVSAFPGHVPAASHARVTR